MPSTETLNLEPRTILGKKVKKLRASQTTPVHLYGPGASSMSLQCDSKTLLKVLSRIGMTAPVSITVGELPDQQLAFAREIQWHPIKNEVLHVDFMRVDVNKRITGGVPIVLIGEAPAARITRGSVVLQLRELEIEALPLEMPPDVKANLEALVEIDDVIRAKDLELASKITLITDPERVIARFEIAREEPAQVEEEITEGETPVDGPDDTEENG